MSTLKLGTQTASVQWTDRSAGTIVSVKRFKTGERAGQVSEIGVRHDKAVRTDDNSMSEIQDYRFEPDPEGGIVICKRKKDGSFVSPGGARIRIGERSAYHDYSF